MTKRKPKEKLSRAAAKELSKVTKRMNRLAALIEKRNREK